MEQVRFVSKCPSCDNNDYISWMHERCSAAQFIDIEGYITCNDCNMKYDILSARFNCGNHSTYFCSPSFNGDKQLITIVHLITKKMDIYDDFKFKLLQNINRRWHEKYG